MTNTTLIPAQLFIGKQEHLAEETEKFLQKLFCKNQSQQNLQSCFCNECRKIKNQQHEQIVFLKPEKDYAVKDLEIIFEKINFALSPNQKFFFILQKAQTLSSTCANKLLKVLEEPPVGYHFILHTNNANAVLPTIISRCHVVNFATENTNDATLDSELYAFTSFFYNQNLDNPAEFEKELKKLELSDSQSIEILNSMINFYAKKIFSYYNSNISNIPFVISISNHTNSTPENIESLEKTYAFLNEKIRKPPQSGSSSLFWKNLYISFPRTK